jgi:hypothetical protein
MNFDLINELRNDVNTRNLFRLDFKFNLSIILVAINLLEPSCLVI